MSEYKNKCGLHKLAWILVFIGSINWGLIGLCYFLGGSNWNLVYIIFGNTMAANLIYVLVGLSAASFLFGGCKKCTQCEVETK